MTSINDRLSTLDEKIQALTALVGELRERLNAAESTMARLDSAFDKVGTDMETVEEHVDTLAEEFRWHRHDRYAAVDYPVTYTTGLPVPSEEVP